MKSFFRSALLAGAMPLSVRAAEPREEADGDGRRNEAIGTRTLLFAY
ncbi:hypothetical protein ACQKOH_00495 [Sphingomonas sp. NPDC092331]|jgi:hypothetical protein|nr:hypothetical protein [Pseudomonadota bacterium]